MADSFEAAAAVPSVYPSPLRAWISLAVMTLASISLGADKSEMSLLFGPVKSTFHFSDAQMGVLQGSSGGIAFLLASVPLGLWVDRGRRITIFFLGALLWSLGTLVTAFAGGFNELFAARFCVGLGGVVLNPVVGSLIADWFPAERRGLAIGINGVGGSIGSGLGISIGGMLLAYFSFSAASTGRVWNSLLPWQAVNVIFALFAFISAFALLALGEPRRHEFKKMTSPIAARFRELWNYRAFLIPLIIGMTFSVSANLVIATWTAAGLERLFGLRPSDFSGSLGSVFLLAGIGGPLLGGLIANSLPEHSPRRLLFAAGVITLMSVPFTFYAFLPNATFFIASAGLLLAAIFAIQAIVTTTIFTSLPNELRGLGMGVDTLVCASIGIGVAPALVGAISDHLHAGRSLGTAIALVVIPATVLAGFSFLIASKCAARGGSG